MKNFGKGDRVIGEIEGFFEKSADKMIWLGIILYVAIFSYLCFLKYQSFGYYDWDFASDIITLWCSNHGRLFYYPFLEEIILGAHLYLIMVLLIPIYAIFQHPFTLLFIQSLFLGLAAYPLYKLAKLRLSKVFSLLIALGYLIYPSIGYINIFETHFEIYEIFFLFFALYYFEKENFKKFLVFIFLAISCKENVSMAVFMMGIYAFLRKRSLKWVVVPVILGGIWFFLSIKVIIPYFAKDTKLYQGGFMFNIYYRQFGNSIGDIVKTIISHPILVAKYAFAPHKILYLLHLFGPTAFLGLMSPSILLMTVPIFAQNLLSSYVVHAQISHQHSALLIPFIFYATIYSLPKLLKLGNSLRDRVTLIILFLANGIIFSLYLGAPQMHLLKYIKGYSINELSKEKSNLIKMIPKDAAVISTFQFLPKLAHRYNLYSMHLVSNGFRMYTKVRYVPPPDLEYALIDFNEPLMLSSFFPPEAPANIRSFLENGNWKVLRGADDVILFKKGFTGGGSLCELNNPYKKIQNEINADINNQLIFVGYDINKADPAAKNILHLTLYWKQAGDAGGNKIIVIQFFDALENVVLTKMHALGYRIYLPKDWPKVEVIKEQYYLFIPVEIKRGVAYNARIGVFSGDGGYVLPVYDKSKIDNQGRIILGDILLE